MPQTTTPEPVAQALNEVRDAARQYRDATTPEERDTARKALNATIVRAVQAGAKQAQVVRITGLSRAQVSRVSRGATSGRTPLPPAKYLVDALPADRIADRYRAGATAVQLGREYGCNSSTILAVLERHGVTRRKGRWIDLPVTDAELVRRYVDERLEIQEIASQLGVKPNLISRRLTAAGVVIPRGQRRMDLPDAEIVARFKRGEPVLRIARAYGVSTPTILRRIREDQSRASA
jgi:transposase-like protein/uncharacterized protein YerC